jgi:hypothetical protein
VLALALVVAMLPACRRARTHGPPKAVPVAQDGALELRLMTFNVRYETNEDLGSRAWQQRVPAIIRMIHQENPDVIGIQEAMHGQAADLWASLPDYEFFGKAREDGHRDGEYSGIFYRRDRFVPAPDDGGTFWLSDTPEKPGSKTWGNRVTRVATWLRLTDRASHRDFYIYNTHWDHQHQGSRDGECRVEDLIDKCRFVRTENPGNAEDQIPRMSEHRLFSGELAAAVGVDRPTLPSSR